MSLYYFDVNEGGAITVDDDGRTCADWSAVEAWATDIARGIIAAEVAIGRLHLDCSVEIRDSDRELCHVLPFTYAINGTAADA